MLRLVIVVGIMIGFSAPAFAQKDAPPGSTGIFESREEYNDFMGSAKRLAYGDNGNAELQAMIPLLNDIVLNQPIGQTATQYNTPASSLGLLSDPEIRADLEMVEEQYQQLQATGKEIQRRMAEEIRGVDFSNSAELVKQIEAIRNRSQAELNALLLPHQLERLQQIQMQAMLRRRGLVDVLTSHPIREDLDITEEQARMLRDAEEEIQLEMERKLEQLRQEAQEKLLQRLSPSQRSKVEAMIGDSFDFEPSSKNRHDSRRKIKARK